VNADHRADFLLDAPPLEGVLVEEWPVFEIPVTALPPSVASGV